MLTLRIPIEVVYRHPFLISWLNSQVRRQAAETPSIRFDGIRDILHVKVQTLPEHLIHSLQEAGAEVIDGEAHTAEGTERADPVDQRPTSPEAVPPAD